MSPLYVGNRVPVLDGFGRPLRGSPAPAEATNRCRVEIRTTTTGSVYAPGTNGAASPYNPLLPTNGVAGMGENAETADAGLFCRSFRNRPEAGTLVFARVFDAPSIADAAFYADSQLATVPADGSSLPLTFGDLRPLDPGDDDGDGLNNSWERVLGTDDRPSADYDGDGMLDLHEMLAGTDPTDPASLLAFLMVGTGAGEVLPAEFDPAAKLIHLRWPSVPGKSYQLESTSALAPDPATGAGPDFIPVNEVATAAAGEYVMDAWIGVSAGDVKGVFRIRLAETGSR
ncbi:MAG: thrombospondin type 3 repeat-containing protein [Kiritimatiellia bacterium]